MYICYSDSAQYSLMVVREYGYYSHWAQKDFQLAMASHWVSLSGNASLIATFPSNQLLLSYCVIQRPTRHIIRHFKNNLPSQSLEWYEQSVFQTNHWYQQTKSTYNQVTITKNYLTISPPIPLRLYTLPYRSNRPFFIFEIRVLWRSGLSARAPECQKLEMVDQTSMALNPSNSSNLEPLALKGLCKYNNKQLSYGRDHASSINDFRWGLNLRLLQTEELLFAPLRHDAIYAYASYGKQTISSTRPSC